MSLQESISRTVAYSHFFGRPLYVQEIHRWLISNKKISLQKVSAQKLPHLDSKDKRLIEKRLQISHQKTTLATKLLKPLFFFPFIKLVGLTGSIAAHNAKEGDDLDVFIVTSPWTLWLVRPVVLSFYSLLHKRRSWTTPSDKSKNLLCFNLWLDQNSLKLKAGRRNLYTAREVLQTIPLIDKDNVYSAFLSQNYWTKSFFANAYPLKKSNLSCAPKQLYYLFFFPLNLVLFLVQYLFMISHRHSQEEVGLGSAFFHIVDYSKKLHNLVPK